MCVLGGGGGGILLPNLPGSKLSERNSSAGCLPATRRNVDIMGVTNSVL